MQNENVIILVFIRCRKETPGYYLVFVEHFCDNYFQTNNMTMI